MRKLEWSPTANEDLKYWRETNIKKYHKVLALCKNACLDPKKGLGKPEPLKHEWFRGFSFSSKTETSKGYWYRRIDKEHRLIYRFDDKTVYIVQARYHY